MLLPFGTAHAFISPSWKLEIRKGLTSMKSEQFHDLNLKQAETILEAAGQLMQLAKKLYCIVQGALDEILRKFKWWRDVQGSKTASQCGCYVTLP